MVCQYFPYISIIIWRPILRFEIGQKSIDMTYSLLRCSPRFLFSTGNAISRHLPLRQGREDVVPLVRYRGASMTTSEGTSMILIRVSKFLHFFWSITWLFHVLGDSSERTSLYHHMAKFCWWTHQILENCLNCPHFFWCPNTQLTPRDSCFGLWSFPCLARAGWRLGVGATQWWLQYVATPSGRWIETQSSLNHRMNVGC